MRNLSQVDDVVHHTNDKMQDDVRLATVRVTRRHRPEGISSRVEILLCESDEQWVARALEILEQPGVIVIAGSRA